MSSSRAFDIQKAAKEFGISAAEMDQLKAETAEEFSPNEILYELHIIRRIHHLAQQRMGFTAWLEHSDQASQEYYRAKGLVECDTPDGTRLLQANKAQAS